MRSILGAAIIGLAVALGIVLLYPWLYCLTDDYILRPDEGRWEYDGGTLWHTYHFPDGSSPQYDRQIDLWLPYVRLGHDSQ